MNSCCLRPPHICDSHLLVYNDLTLTIFCIAPFIHFSIGPLKMLYNQLAPLWIWMWTALIWQVHPVADMVGFPLLSPKSNLFCLKFIIHNCLITELICFSMVILVFKMTPRLLTVAEDKVMLFLTRTNKWENNK